jgi:hypothetical protein
MPRPKHTPEIIIGKLREVEVLVAKGATVAEASHQISSAVLGSSRPAAIRTKLMWRSLSAWVA